MKTTEQRQINCHFSPLNFRCGSAFDLLLDLRSCFFRHYLCCCCCFAAAMLQLLLLLMWFISISSLLLLLFCCSSFVVYQYPFLEEKWMIALAISNRRCKLNGSRHIFQHQLQRRALNRLTRIVALRQHYFAIFLSSRKSHTHTGDRAKEKIMYEMRSTNKTYREKTAASRITKTMARH